MFRSLTKFKVKNVLLIYRRQGLSNAFDKLGTILVKDNLLSILIMRSKGITKLHFLFTYVSKIQSY